MADQVQFPLRWPPALRDRFKALAMRNRRSLNSELLSALERADDVPPAQLEAELSSEKGAA